MIEFVITMNGKKERLTFLDDSKVLYNGQELEFEIIEFNKSVYLLRIDKNIFNFTCTNRNYEQIVLFSQSKKFELTVRTSLQEKANELLSNTLSAHHHSEVKAPMPGMILKLKKNKGDSVSHSEAVLILEAMKMENEIRSNASGVIKEIYVKEGAAVEKGTILFSVEN